MNVCADKDVTSDHDDGSQRFGELRAFTRPLKRSRLMTYLFAPHEYGRCWPPENPSKLFTATDGRFRTCVPVRTPYRRLTRVVGSSPNPSRRSEHIRASGRSMDLRRLFKVDDVASILKWHRSLRSTVVQVYDWMASYTEPLGPKSGWEDPSHRPVSFDALRELATGLRAQGSVTHAYVPIYAVGHGFAKQHPRCSCTTTTARPFVSWTRSCWRTLGMHRGNVTSSSPTARPPRRSDLTASTSTPTDIRASLSTRRQRHRHAQGVRILSTFREKRLADVLISFNQVNGVPSGARLAPGPRFRYCEIWPRMTNGVT